MLLHKRLRIGENQDICLLKNEHAKINKKGRRNDAKNSMRSPPNWQNKFVIHKSPILSYCYSCNGYGHRASECRKRSRNDQDVSSRDRNVVCHRCHGHGHKSSSCRKSSQ